MAPVAIDAPTLDANEFWSYPIENELFIYSYKLRYNDVDMGEVISVIPNPLYKPLNPFYFTIFFTTEPIV